MKLIYPQRNLVIQIPFLKHEPSLTPFKSPFNAFSSHTICNDLVKI